MSAFVETLGKTGKLLTVRKLSAIYRATDNELKMAETDPTWMAKFEDQAAERPFRETFEDAMSFHAALWESLGVSPVSSAPAEPPAGKGKKSKTSGGSRSGA